MKNTARRTLAIFAFIGIFLGGIHLAQPASVNAQTIQQGKDTAENTSTIIEELTDDDAFDNGSSRFLGKVGNLGKALKIGGAALGLLDIILELAKQDRPTIDQQILDSVGKANDKLDGLDRKLDRKFEELDIKLDKNRTYINLTAAGKEIDAEFQRWTVNKARLPQKTTGIMSPEYLNADAFFKDASAVANVCKGLDENESIYNLTAEANKKSYTTLPLLHIRIANKLYKAGALGTYQRYRASYLTELLRRTNGVERVGQMENQIDEIEKNPANGSIPFQQLRDQYFADAKLQAAKEMEPYWSVCEKAFSDAVTKYSDPANVQQAAKSVVENEFFTNNISGFNQDKLSLLLTDDNTQTYQKGSGLTFGFSNDGTIDPTKAGGQFSAAIGKRLEDLFPGYGFVVLAYTQYDSFPTIRNSVSSRCSGAEPRSWDISDAFGNSAKKPLSWSNIPVEGPLRICAGYPDNYSFNLIVSGFQRAKAQDATTKSFLNSSGSNAQAISINYNHVLVTLAKADSEEGGKTNLRAAKVNFNPSLVTTFAALPDFVNGRRAESVYYLYPSKFTDSVFYPKLKAGEKLFYVITPAPF